MSISENGRNYPGKNVEKNILPDVLYVRTEKDRSNRMFTLPHKLKYSLPQKTDI
ncbi:hypothetical protein GCM10027566_06370 [Arachidicoccus ginsenosidivorans]|jgi:hypothetical protein